MDDVNRLERKQAAKDGASLVKNSGRGINKGDARKGDMLIDYKFTDGKSFSLNIEKFRKHEIDAIRAGLEPCIVAIFNQHKHRQIAMIDWEYLLDIQEKAWRYDDLCDDV